ncbi:MAG: hypothetical protein M5U28_25845 [Sandaracinaceae bacterium]|nr:hypothetical protein [Sandaracinaceae bacterium]
MTVRELRAVLRERGGEEEANGEAGGEERIATMERRLDPLEAWMLEATIPMIELLDGRREPGAWMESLLAEAQCALTNLGPDVDVMPQDVAERHRAFVESVRAGVERVARREEQAEGSLPAMPAPSCGAVEAPPEGALAIDRAILRELAPRLASCDLRMGELLARFFRGRGWRVLGFAGEAQYARERLGMSRSAVLGRVTLCRRSLHLAPIAGAVGDGRIGWEAATLVGRVATPDTVKAWIDRATRRTFRHLREEVSAAQLMKRMMHTGEDPSPPTDEEVAIVLALERDMKCGAYARRAFGIEREDDAPELLDRATAQRSGAYAEMARAARAVEHTLRAVVGAVGEGAASITSEDAESACLGVTAPPPELPTTDLDEDVVWPSMLLPSEHSARAPAEPPSEHRAAAPIHSSAHADLALAAVPHEHTGRAPIQTPVDAGLAPTEVPREHPEAAPIQTSAGLAPGLDLFAPRMKRSVLALLRAREDLLLQWRMLEAAHARAGVGGSFVQFIVLAFWSTWAPVLGRTNACEAILRRDGYDCTCPVCTRPSSPGSHHVVFRSRGGGEEHTNKTSPCDWCHLDGVHDARLKVTGEAPDLVWLIGRAPIMEVRGRERRLLR